MYLLLSWGLCCQVMAGQSVDSLKAVLQEDLSDTDRMKTLALLTRDYRYSEDSCIKYGYILLSVATRLKDQNFIEIASMNIGQSYKDLGAYEAGAKYLLMAIEVGEKINKDVSAATSSLASLYGRIGDMRKSSELFRRNLKMIDSLQYAEYLRMLIYNNQAEAFYKNEMIDSANIYFHQAYDIAKKENYNFFIHFISGNLGMVNLRLGNLDSAEIQLKRVLEYDKIAQSHILIFRTLMAELYQKRKDYTASRKLLDEVLESSDSLGYLEQQRDAYLVLSNLYKGIGEDAAALEAYMRYVEIRDKLQNINVITRIASLQYEYQLSEKEAEIAIYQSDKENREFILWVVAVFAILLMLLVVLLIRQNMAKSRLNSELGRQRDELGALNQTKDKFFGIISHDLRGPVNAFYGVSRMIKFLAISQKTDELIEVADDLNRSVDQLSNLLDNLLSWAMQQRGHFPNVPEKVDVGSLLDELTESMHNLAVSKNIEFVADIHKRIFLWADYNIVSTILRNLINNALKYTPEGGQVHVGVVERGDVVEVLVKDSGVGIPSSRMQSLFGVQNTESTFGTSGEKGLGLGLQIVKELVDLVNAEILVESTINKGTTFTVRFAVFEPQSAVVVQN